MAEDLKESPAVLGEAEVVTAPVEGTHGGRHMTSTSGTQEEVDSALRYSVQTEGTSPPDTVAATPAVAPAPDAAPVTPDVVAPDPKSKDRGSVQDRISHYTLLAREADQRAVLAEQRAANLELQLATQPTPETPAAPAVEPIPAELATTQELGDYIARTVKAGVETGLAERDTRTREAQAEVAATQAKTAWTRQISNAAAEHEDWDQVFLQAATTETGTISVEQLAETFPNGAHVLYDLVKNSPQALTRMGQMSPRDRERAFAVAADRVQRATEGGQADPVAPMPPATPTPSAPTPMTPVAPSAPSVEPPVLNEHSTREDYKAWKAARGIKF